MRSSTTILGAVLLLGGCAIQAEGDRGYVLLDEAARNAGLAVEHGGEPEAYVRPAAIREGNPAHLVDADGRAEPLDVAPGEVVLVRGARGHVDRWPLGTARPDVLVALATDEQGAVELGEAIDADVLMRDESTFELVGPAVWENASELEVMPHQITELLPAVGDEMNVPERDEATALFPDAAETSSAEALVDDLIDPSAALAAAGEAIVPVDIVLARLVASGTTGLAFGEGAPEGFRFSRPEPGSYAVSIRSSFSGGCSRSWTNGTTRAVIVLQLGADGTATACRSRVTSSTTTSMSFDDDGPGRSAGYRRYEEEQQGYRGRWQRDGAGIALAFHTNDSVCPRVFRGTTPPAAMWTMSCAAVRSHGEIDLPTAGLACAFPTDASYYEYDGYALRPLISEVQMTLLGPGHGWEITTESMRWGGSGRFEVTRAPALIEPASVFVPTPFL
jgi:hypothetical protein